MPKPGNWGDWAVIHNPKPEEGSLCGGCIFCFDDGSCSKQPILIREVGHNFWKKCPHYTNGNRKKCSITSFSNTYFKTQIPASSAVKKEKSQPPAPSSVKKDTKKTKQGQASNHSKKKCYNCHYCSHVQEPKQGSSPYICKNICSPNYSSKCSMCQYFVDKDLLRYMSLPEYERLMAKIRKKYHLTPSLTKTNKKSSSKNKKKNSSDKPEK